MSFMSSLFRRRRKVTPVGTTLESGVTVQRDLRPAILKGLMFISLVVLAVLALPRDNVLELSASTGELWTKPDVAADFDFAIHKSDEELRLERQQIRLRTPPLFARVPDALANMQTHRDTVRSQIDRLYRSYRSLPFDSAGATILTPFFIEQQQAARFKLTPGQWSTLLSAYARGFRIDRALLRETYRIARNLATQGTMDIPHDSVLTDRIVIRNEVNNTDIEAALTNVVGLNDAYSTVEDELAERFTEQQVQIGIALFGAVFQPSLQYMQAETLANWTSRESNISPTEGVVTAGETIVEQGDLVTAEIQKRLASYELAIARKRGNQLGWTQTLGQFLLVTAILFFFALYLLLLRPAIFEDTKMMLLVTILFAIIIGLYLIAATVGGWGLYVVPVAMVSILLTIIFDSRVAIFGTVTLALLGGLILQMNYEYVLATVFAASLGIYSVRDIKNRSQFFISAGLVFLGFVLVLGGFALIRNTLLASFLSTLGKVGLHSFLIILAYPLLWVFERSFGITTDLTLLELSDTNLPLLKDLSIKAPGTFNHTLQVANLAEAAADRIGANALLTRVGALYHDIGKMEKPEYFVENQRVGVNPHDQLKPRMSALIIISHVKEGLEIGRQNGLPERVLQFIPSHHGTTLVEYFHRIAANAESADDPISESEFRYPGPKPDSKESGILMLADSVEAASRAMDSPSHKKFDALIQDIFNARIASGQLNNTSLNFRELAEIKETFLNMLAGMYHARIKYPDKPENADAD